jgi:hypothetical protein
MRELEKLILKKFESHSIESFDLWLSILRNKKLKTIKELKCDDCECHNREKYLPICYNCIDSNMFQEKQIVPNIITKIKKFFNI